MDKRKMHWLRSGKKGTPIWKIEQSLSGIMCSRCRELKTIGWVLNTNNTKLPYYLHDGYFICTECVKKNPEVRRGLENDTNHLTKKVLEEKCHRCGTYYHKGSEWHLQDTWYYLCRHCLDERVLVTKKMAPCPECNRAGIISLKKAFFTYGIKFLFMDTPHGSKRGVICDKCKGTGNISVYIDEGDEGELPFQFSITWDVL